MNAAPTLLSIRCRLSSIATAFSVAAVAASLLGATPAAAVDIKWSASDTFEHMAAIQPGKAAEICGTIEPRLPVDWRFSANGPLTFDIHRHSGSEVIYAVRSFMTREQNGRFTPTFNYDWCWMWTNESDAVVTVRVELKR